MADYPTSIPETFFKGDTLQFQKSFSGYSAADGWACSYVFNGPAKQTLTLTADSSGFIYSGSTSAWTAGTYWYQGVVTNGSESHTVDTGSLTLKSAIGTASTYDGRTQNMRILEAINSMLEGKASDDAQELEINGKRLVKYRPKDLLSLRDYFSCEVAKDRARERIAKGLPGPIVKVRFP